VPTNTELAHRAYERLHENDLDGFLEYVHPDAEWHSLVLEIEGAYHGHDGVREWWNGIVTTFPDWDPSIVDVREIGDVVVIHAHATGQAASSGVGIDDDFWQAAEVRDGKISRYATFRTEAEAVATAEAWNSPSPT
jgi:ketosteroid isomerase-like protein